MKKSEAYITQAEQPVAEQLDAPVRLTPEQLENVAAGFRAQLSLGGGAGSTATTGLYPAQPSMKLK